MKLPWLLIFGFVIVSNAEHDINKRESSDHQKKVVCYYTNWSVYRPGTAKFSPQNINPYLCTHLIYAFGGLDKENGLRPYDKYQDIEQGGYAKFNGLKTYNKNLKTLLAIGGWNEGSARFSKLVDDESKRKEFVKNVIKFLRQNNFDGLDLDWEYPAYRDGSKPSDKENYASLVKELREEFNRESSKTGRSRLLLTMAVPAGIEYIDKGYDVPELNKHLDFMNLLTYDYHSSYEPAVNHHSPLYPLEEDSEYNFDAKLNIDHTIKHYIASGADKNKLVLGIPTYGRSYTLFNKESTDIGAPSDGPGEKGEATREKGYLAYYEICGNLKKDDTWTIEQPKPRAMGPYAFKDNQWVGYDDEEFVKLKAKYANENDLGGIMFWSIDNDDFRGSCHSRAYPLIEAGKEALLGDSKVESSQGKETKTSLKSRTKPRPVARTTTSAPPEKSAASTTTPEPPTTPDTGTDFTCKDEGFFPHPRECKKYFWCLDSGPSNLGIVAHQFTCPSGLVFNKVSDSCDYSRNVICKDKKTADVTTTTTTTPKPTKSGIKITTTTSTTTTTTQAPEVEEDAEDEFEEEEDPKEIKQLITLIKKLGGVAELEKQLNIKDGSTEVTTPAISKSLYNKVLKLPSNRFQSSYINGPGPQSEGLDNKDDNKNYKKDKPQYVTIRRQRPSKDVSENNKESEEDEPFVDTTTERFKPTYKTVDRSRYRDLGEVADGNSESDSSPKYTTISRTRSTEIDTEETTSPKYVTLRRQRPTYKEEEISDEEITPVSVVSTSPTSQAPRYVSLLRQRSTTTTTTPVEDRVIETTTRDNFEEPRENKNTKVSDGAFTTESSIFTTTLFNIEPLTEIITTTENVPTITVTKSSETTEMSSPVTEYISDTKSTATVPTSIPIDINDTTAVSATRAPTSTVTNVITSIYEAATERQRVRVKNIQNFLLEHKKSEPVTQSVTSTATPSTTILSSTTIENVIATEEPTQKSILKGRFGGGQVHFRPTLRKPTVTPEKIVTTTEKTIETTTEKKLESTTEKRFRLNKYVNRFVRPVSSSTENTSTTGKRFIKSNTENSLETSSRPFNRFRTTTSSETDNSLPLTRRSFSRFRSSTVETPTSTSTLTQTPTLTSTPLSNTEIQKSRFFRSRRPVGSSSTTTSTTEVTTISELLNSEENADNVRYETTAYPPTSVNFPSTIFEETATSNEEFKITKVDSFEPTKYITSEITTIILPTTGTIFKPSRGSVRANNAFEESIDDTSRSPLSGRHNSRFLKDEQKILYIRVLPSPNGRSQNEFTSNQVKNVTRNRGRIRAFDSLELNTLNDGLMNDDDRPREIFRGSETKFRVQPSTTTQSTEEIQQNRTRHRITRPIQRTTTTTTTTTEDSSPISSTESYSVKANRRRKFRPEYTTTSTSSYEEELTTPRSRNPERKFRSRTSVSRNTVTTSTTPETLEENDKKLFSSSPQPYYDDSSLFAKTRDDRKIGGSAEDLANTAVVAIHTLATAPPSNYEFRPSTHSPVQQQNVFHEPTQKHDYFEPRAPHAKDAFEEQPAVRVQQQQQLTQPQPAARQPTQPPSIKLPVSFQPAPFQPSPFQAGPFQPLPYPALPFQTNDAFAPIARQQSSVVHTTAMPPATSRQTFLIRRGPAPSRTTPLSIPPTTARSPPPPPPPPQYLNDNAQEQYADYSEPSAESQVALKGKVRIHGDGYIECLDMGSFPHPFSCQKFISCAKTEYGALFGWEYTCPKGLSFDPVGGICNWSSGPVCNSN